MIPLCYIYTQILQCIGGAPELFTIFQMLKKQNLQNLCTFNISINFLPCLSYFSHYAPKYTTRERPLCSAKFKCRYTELKVPIKQGRMREFFIFMNTVTLKGLLHEIFKGFFTFIDKSGSKTKTHLVFKFLGTFIDF